PLDNRGGSAPVSWCARRPNAVLGAEPAAMAPVSAHRTRRAAVPWISKGRGPAQMDLNSPDAWRWIWLVTAAAFSVAEAVTPQAFFFLPFAIGALLGAVLALAGVALGLEWVAFVVGTAAAYAVLWPIGRRLARGGPQHAIGANRWVGREALVMADIPAELGGTGLVRLDREQW